MIPKPITLLTCECGNDTFRIYTVSHRWSPDQQLWWGWDTINRCTKCGKEYYEEMDQKEHSYDEYHNRQHMEEVGMGREELVNYLSQKEQK